MKSGKEHRVPLSDRVIELLDGLPREDGTPFLFIGARRGKPLSNMAMLELLKGMCPGHTVHGFRSTFRTWAAERTNYPHHVCEAALAHTIPDVGRGAPTSAATCSTSAADCWMTGRNSAPPQRRSRPAKRLSTSGANRLPLRGKQPGLRRL